MFNYYLLVKQKKKRLHRFAFFLTFKFECITDEMSLQACGAKYYLKGEFLDEIDVDDVVVALVDLARRVSFYVMSVIS